MSKSNSIRLRLVATLIALCLLDTAAADQSAIVNSVGRDSNSTVQPDRELPIVSTALGDIRGAVLQSRLGVPFYAFRGIRYGKSPVGERRFRVAEPVDAWDGVFDATDDGPMCVQWFTNASEVSEDCLRLNVYTRNVDTSASNRTSARKPVIVYIHPGGFYAVSGQSKNFAGPQNLLDRDIVLLTLNYRLGTLGMLATGTKEAPGNVALKDQVLVLRWVQQHIAHFGGDPDSVTLLGYSAGAWSITLHMVSPMSAGLFHKAIVMSGSSTGQLPLPSEQLHLAKRQAGLLDCPADGIEQMLECMRNANATAFGETLSAMFEFGRGNPVLLWSPVIEPDFGQERFLTDNPTRLFQLGQFQRVPVMAGITELEFVSPAIDILQDPQLRYELDTNFSQIAPLCFLYERDTDRSQVISQTLRKEFLNGPLLDMRSLPGLATLFGDGLISFSMHRLARLASLYTTVYYYKNEYVGRFSHLYYPGDKPYGTVHHDDLLYLFAVPVLAPIFQSTDPENLQVERMTRLWTNFARHGDPNDKSDAILQDVHWQQMNSSRLNYLNIGDELEMRDGLFRERFEKWAALFPLQTIGNETDVVEYPEMTDSSDSENSGSL